mmetsp:Transcript_8300/g.11491  ORF Transcript_8300/g.11491 Transcript_8300/m.11491 type:complete len:121 (+) Transcript_8300:253-615(+)
MQISKFTQLSDAASLQKSELPSFDQGLNESVMAVIQQRYLLFTGGENCNFEPVNTVVAFDTLAESWESFPSLNVARSMPSSCVMGSTVYVFGGSDDTDDCVNTLEILRLNDMGKPEPETQ